MELSELIDSIDIVAYISQFVELEQRGEEFWGLSPFKDEKTPSFSVRPNPPCFYDYSSGIGGNVFTFTRFYFDCSSYTAVQKLREYAGCDSEVRFKREKLEATKECMRFRPQKKTKKEQKSTILPDNVMQKFEKRPACPDVFRTSA